MVAEDVPAAYEMAHSSLREAGRHYGWQMPELDARGRDRGSRRLHHCLAHDPDGCFVAEQDRVVVGLGVATRRERVWFLSLLAVRTDAQAVGIGGALLTATLGTFEGVGAICASNDPKALRRYRRAGFELSPCFEAAGPVSRSRLPATGGVRDGDYDADRDLVETVARELRGGPHGPDLDFYAAGGHALLVTERDGRGYAVASETGPVVLGATTAAAATALLAAVLARNTAAKAEVDWLTHEQQWAIDVALDAGLSLRPSGTWCQAGPAGTGTPYLPSGAFG